MARVLYRVPVSGATVYRSDIAEGKDVPGRCPELDRFLVQDAHESVHRPVPAFGLFDRNAEVTATLRYAMIDPLQPLSVTANAEENPETEAPLAPCAAAC